jgi:hypothetical protein
MKSIFSSLFKRAFFFPSSEADFTSSTEHTFFAHDFANIIPIVPVHP